MAKGERGLRTKPGFLYHAEQRHTRVLIRGGALRARSPPFRRPAALLLSAEDARDAPGLRLALRVLRLRRRGFAFRRRACEDIADSEFNHEPKTCNVCYLSVEKPIPNVFCKLSGFYFSAACAAPASSRRSLAASSQILGKPSRTFSAMSPSIA